MQPLLLELSYVKVLGAMYIWRPQNFGDFRHPPPPCPHFMQPISTICPQNLAILEPPSPLSADVLYVWSLRCYIINISHSPSLLTFQVADAQPEDDPSSVRVFRAVQDGPHDLRRRRPRPLLGRRQLLRGNARRRGPQAQGTIHKWRHANFAHF